MIIDVRNEYLRLASDDHEAVMFITRKEVQQFRQFIETHHKWLRPNKDWDNCPYESHHNTCDCRGMGGDR